MLALLKKSVNGGMQPLANRKSLTAIIGGRRIAFCRNRCSHLPVRAVVGALGVGPDKFLLVSEAALNGRRSGQAEQVYNSEAGHLVLSGACRFAGCPQARGADAFRGFLVARQSTAMEFLKVADDRRRMMRQ